MTIGFVIRKNQYYDSVFLMGVNKHVSDEPGILQAAVLMASEKNRELLAGLGIRDPQIDSATANDLVVAVLSNNQTSIDAALAKVDAWLMGSEERKAASNLRTLEDGLAQKPSANLAVISVPGEFAAREAHRALEAGLNVFLFSDNVSLADELKLKQLASQKNLLVMGPDCGTSLISGVGIGFANVIRKGSIGVIGGAGTGLQEFTCQVHHAGFGISHAIGTGSHDLNDAIGGLTTLAALDALEKDPRTTVIAILSKPPSMQTLTRLLERIRSCTKPVVGCFIGIDEKLTGAGEKFSQAGTIDEAVELAIHATKGKTPSQLHEAQFHELANKERSGFSVQQHYVRGLFAGGTFCYQSQHIFKSVGLTVQSNAPLEKANRLENPDQSRQHTLIDMGDDYYTQGKPHPMIDGTMRRQRILAESKDPEVAVLLLDFILGYNSSHDPVGELLDAIIAAKKASIQRGGYLSVVTSICGTEDDTQDLKIQTGLLKDAGVIVFTSNAQAALFCTQLIKP
jgi:succinyl-CoA synthetase alpha subunit